MTDPDTIPRPLAGYDAEAGAPATAAPARRRGLRFDRLDALRGAAIVWMAVFHFCFDLNERGWLHPHQFFYRDPFWVWQRNCIVSTFLFCAGAGQAVAMASGQTWGRFWRRWSQVAGCALLVSAMSLVMFPRAWIHFGVLHGMAVMLLMLRVLGGALPPARVASRPGAFVAAAALAVLAWRLPHVFSSPFFDSRWTNWTGLVTHLPITADYVPVMPWFGMMLAGYLAMSLAMAHAQRVAAGPVVAPARGLALLGRWSLSFYMLHQPVLVGLLTAVAWLAGPTMGG